MFGIQNLILDKSGKITKQKSGAIQFWVEPGWFNDANKQRQIGWTESLQMLTGKHKKVLNTKFHTVWTEL